LPSHQFPYNAPAIGTGSVYTVWYQSNQLFPSVGFMWASRVFAPQISGGILEQHDNAANPESLVRHELCAITWPWVADMDSIAVPQAKRAFKKKSEYLDESSGRESSADASRPHGCSYRCSRRAWPRWPGRKAGRWVYAMEPSPTEFSDVDSATPADTPPAAKKAQLGWIDWWSGQACIRGGSGR
jgi:hypothetical protein